MTMVLAPEKKAAVKKPSTNTAPSSITDSTSVEVAPEAPAAEVAGDTPEE